MNETSVPTEQVENKLIHFTPTEPCERCPRITNVAILDRGYADSFTPVCALHGCCTPYGTLATPREFSDEITSVQRFVVWMHNEQGRVSLVAAVEPEQIPGYTVNLEPFSFEPLCWLCQYEAPDGAQVEAFAVWDIVEREFSLFEDGVQITERREQVA